MLFLACKQYSEGRGICQAFLIIPDRYVAIRRELPSPGGWSSPSSYEHIPEMRDLCLYRPLLDKIESLIGDEMVLHLNLTGWVSTERNWHQDDYLNHRNVNGWYIAVWMALDDISPDCGPFEYIPGSHRWPVLRGDRVRAGDGSRRRERARLGNPRQALDHPFARHGRRCRREKTRAAQLFHGTFPRQEGRRPFVACVPAA